MLKDENERFANYIMSQTEAENESVLSSICKLLLIANQY